MTIRCEKVIPVLPATDVALSLLWWTGVCGFVELFRTGEPLSYAGVAKDEVQLQFALIVDTELARTVGAQTMVRVQVAGAEAFYAEYRQRGGTVHPNGGLERKPWGSLEFAAGDPCGVCVTFFE